MPPPRYNHVCLTIPELVSFVRVAGEGGQGLLADKIGAPHVAFAADDVRAVHRRWSAQSVRLVSGPSCSTARDSLSAIMRDPDGIMIEPRARQALSAEQIADARKAARRAA